LRLLGELTGDEAALREAVDVLAPTTAAVELARARCALGRQAQVPDDEAIELLQAALETALDRGALGIRQRARAALARRGRSDDSGRDARRHPTSTERRIVALAAAGHDIRAVAQQLFLTPGTVQAVLESASRNGFKFPSSQRTDPRSLATGRTP
jgi:DNA-binding NarL/FixJ family response regulator